MTVENTILKNVKHNTLIGTFHAMENLLKGCNKTSNQLTEQFSHLTRFVGNEDVLVQDLVTKDHLNNLAENIEKEYVEIIVNPLTQIDTSVGLILTTYKSFNQKIAGDFSYTNDEDREILNEIYEKFYNENSQMLDIDDILSYVNKYIPEIAIIADNLSKNAKNEEKVFAKQLSDVKDELNKLLLEILTSTSQLVVYIELIKKIIEIK